MPWLAVRKLRLRSTSRKPSIWNLSQARFPCTTSRSGVNRSQEARIGIALRFVPTEVQQQAANPLAILVRGHDAHGHFELLEPPTESDPRVVAQRRKQIVEQVYGNLLPPE